VLSASWVKDAPRLLAFADEVKRFAAVVSNFDQVVPHPEGVQVFFAITICLLPLKILLFYLYMHLTYDPQEEAKTPLSFLMIIMFIFMPIGELFYILTFDRFRGADAKGMKAFMIFGIKSEGFFLWLSWSIIALGCASFVVSGTLLTLWKKCISVFHNLKGSKNE
jgi:hypothetical protein